MRPSKFQSTMQLLASVLIFAATTAAIAQVPSTPAISQLFAFYCNSGYTLCPDGFQPALGPVQLSDGNFYGTMWYGKTSVPLGTVWQATPAGDVKVIYSFMPGASGQFADGSYPVIGFAAGADGNLYGVTQNGGTQNDGVFYRLTTSGEQTVLYNFCSLSGCIDQGAAIVLATDGNFYGVNGSVVFKLTPEGAWTALYTFVAPEKGEKLIAGTDGNLYGIEISSPLQTSQETIFRLTTGGTFTALHTFPNLNHVDALTQSARGTLFGAFCCATNDGVFQINSTGSFRVIQKTPADSFPPTTLVVGSDNNLYGLIADGSDYAGYVFAMSPAGKTLFSEEFVCASEGCNPLSLIEGSDGNLYGLTNVGGTVASGDNSNGTIFKVATGLK